MTSPRPFLLEQCWSELRRWAAYMLGVFGAPAFVAARGLFSRDERADVMAFLMPLETGVRRLLLIEAAALPKEELPKQDAPPPARSPRPPKKPGPRAARSVAFRLVPCKPRDRVRSRDVRQRKTHYSARYLACRMQAVLRVLENRALYVEKLGRKLQAAPAGTLFSLNSDRAPPRRRATLLRYIAREAERTVMAMNARTDTS